MAFASTHVIDFHYDSVSKDLTVYFLAGGKIKFHDVPYDKYADFLQAKSKGKYFDTAIKDKFEHTKIY